MQRRGTAYFLAQLTGLIAAHGVGGRKIDRMGLSENQLRIQNPENGDWFVISIRRARLDEIERENRMAAFCADPRNEG
jgi:hypothetical protein